jgi:hypothetical protein
MKLITVDGREWDVKYKQNAESITNDFGTTAVNYPNFVGSKIYQNSSSSDKYNLVFAIHITLLVGLKESIKKLVPDENDAVVHPTYGKLTHIILEHPLWGAIKGSILGSITYNTGKEGDIIGSCLFQEHTDDEPVEKKDVEVENLDATNGINTETTANFDVSLSTGDLSAISGLANRMSNLYTGILDSSVISAFNDLNTAISATLIDSQRIMNSVKGIIELPNRLLSLNLSTRLNLLKQQAETIKATPVNSFNLALFNMNSLAYNTGVTSRTVFISEAAQQAAAGIKTVPL